MNEFGHLKSGLFQHDRLQTTGASASMFSDKCIQFDQSSKHSFQNPLVPLSYGFSMEIPPRHHSNVYDPTLFSLHPSSSKAGRMHEGQEPGQVHQSSKLAHQSYSHIVSHNIVSSNGIFKTVSQSGIPQQSFENLPTKQSNFHANAPNRSHISNSVHQCQEMQVQCGTSGDITDTNHCKRMPSPVNTYSHATLQDCEENVLFRRQRSSSKGHENVKPVQMLVNNLPDSETTKCSMENSLTKTISVSPKQQTETSRNDLFCKLAHVKAYFKCGFCELKLSSNEALLGHIKTHIDLMPYSCNLCGICFVEAGQLLEHVHQSHSLKAPYACGLCKLTFYQNMELKQHVQIHHVEEKEESSNVSDPQVAVNDKKEVQGDSLTYLSARKEDVEFDNGIDKETEEDDKSKGFSGLNSEVMCLSSNTVVVSKNTTFNFRREPSKMLMNDIDLESVCTVIVKPSTAGGMRKKHLFKCNFCQKICKDKGSLVSHARTHTKGRPYECNVCFAKFKQYAHLSDHIMTKHTKDRPYVCDRCAKSFTRKSHLLDHIRLRHTEDKLYHCAECPLSFQKRAEFSEHKLTHGKPAKYHCNICLRQFRNVTDYDRHIRSHTKEKLFECEICHLTFGLLANAKKHMIKHNKERPFKCDVCPKAYHFEHDFKRHKMTHLKKKPHPCSDCYKSFKTSALLKKHSKIAHMKTEVTSKPSFQCLICKKQFKSQMNLERHSHIHLQKNDLDASEDSVLNSNSREKK